MENTSIIKIALADDHVLVRAGLAQIINNDENLEVKAEASNGKELLDILNSESIDVVLLDIDMPVMDGKATLEHIVIDFPEVKVIMLTVHQHDSFIVHMMKAGAHGYLLKECEPTEVIKAIKTVKEEGLYFNDRVSKALLGGVSSKKSSHLSTLGESLNQRELEVLMLICKERTTIQIAEELFLSPKTIEGYRKSLLEKTNTKNAAGLAIYAVKNGLI
jgi:DNA-binding NarL/FixJ family response regulator